jgi:hypothetical protein
MEHFPHSFRWMGYGEMDWLGCMTGNGYGFMDGASIFSFSFAHKNEFPTSFMHLGLRWRLYLRTLWGWRAWGTTQGCAGLSLEGITAVKRYWAMGMRMISPVSPLSCSICARPVTWSLLFLVFRQMGFSTFSVYFEDIFRGRAYIENLEHYGRSLASGSAVETFPVNSQQTTSFCFWVCLVVTKSHFPCLSRIESRAQPGPSCQLYIYK